MLGMKEEEAEREEALQAAAAEMEVAEGGMVDDTTHPDEEGMERDLDEEIPNAEEEPSGLIEEGEEGLEEEEGEYMERDLDDDGYADEDYDGLGLEGYDDDDFDNQPDLDAEIPEESERDLDDEIPDAESSPEEWQHTDSEEELSDEDESSTVEPGIAQPQFADNFRTSTPNSRGGVPPPTLRRERETDAQRRFLNRWSGGGDAFDSSSMLYSDGDLGASITSQGSRRSGLERRPRHIGGPRDSLN